MKSNARCYEELRHYIDDLPMVDCHDHTSVLSPRHTDPFQALLLISYSRADFISATSEANIRIVDNVALPLETRWAAFEKGWKRMRHTGYAQLIRRALKRFYGEDEPTLAGIHRMQGRLLNLEDAAAFEAVLEEAKIVVRLVNIRPDVSTVIDGTLRLTPRARLVIPLPAYHAVRSYTDVETIARPLGRNITSLDEYLDACRTTFTSFKRFGAVAFKDQSAYERTLEYGNPTRAAAEAVFNDFMEDPRRSAAYPDGVKPLDDYLFHEFMRMARDMDLPVQFHTGHMAGVRNDVGKANASGLTRLLELHRDVRFDLFHANWPFSAEILFLTKNFPNVALDFCWAHVIDPIYCQNLMKQAISCIPHSKIHGYGSDFKGQVDKAWAHASIARENVAIALSDLVETDYLDLDAAKEIALGWLFANPNEFFRLGLTCTA